MNRVQVSNPLPMPIPYDILKYCMTSEASKQLRYE
jgi:hypothetical protein